MFSSGLCKSILLVEIYYILMETKYRIFFEILTQEFDIIFDYNLQSGPKIELLSITITQI